METAVRRRVYALMLAVLAIALAIGARLTYLQIGCSEKLRARASGQHYREINVPATRGTIFDREGRELALSLKTESLFAHPRRVEDPEGAARLLAPLVGLSRAEILERLRSDKTFVYIDRFLEPEQAAEVRALDLPIGDSKPFGFLPSSKRYYPRGKLAAHVIGFASIDGEGVEGIEKQLDYELRGDPTVYLILQDGLKGLVRRKTIAPPAKQPRHVVLSIDVVLQHIVERELERAMRETRASGASAILMEPASGQILALVNRPAADLERYGRASAAQRTNRAMVHQYEPGSTFKIVTMAAALERGKVRPHQRFDCEQGSYTYRGRRIRDIARNGILSASEAFERSSNVCMVKIVGRLAPHDLQDTIVRFGFGSRTGIELPGELSGTLHPLADWSVQTQPSLAFGYEVGVTVLQMASAFALVANDGVRAPGRIVIGLRDADGHVRRITPPEPYRVIDSAVARELTTMMEGVVERGSGTRARLPGYRIAGKSGTAHKLVDGRYSDSACIASFGGFAPISAPRLAALVVLDTPRGEHYGGQVAAPVFRRIMDGALNYMRAPRGEGAMTLVRADRAGHPANGSATTR